jgi:putative transposase
MPSPYTGHTRRRILATMPNYRRAFAPGGCWFFTVNLLDRRQQLLTEHVDILRKATRLTQARHPFTIDAMVVLPDHIHAVWTLPPGDTDFSLRWRLIKIGFAKAIPKTEPRSPIRIARGERAVWQRRFWEHLIRDEKDFRRHVEYCYINPVKHGLVTRVCDWPHSSFHRDVRNDLFPKDWGGDVSVEGAFGERV